MVSFTADGDVVFEIYLPHAQDIVLLGDFTQWESAPIRMLRQQGQDEGWWRVLNRLAPGDYSFSYLVDGRSWVPDYAAAGVRRNSYGRWTSLLNVADKLAPVVVVRNDAPAAKSDPRPIRLDRQERVRNVSDADSDREFSTSARNEHRHTA